MSFAGKYQNLFARCIFTLALDISETLTFTIFNLQKVGYGLEYNFHNVASRTFALAVTVSETLTFRCFALKSMSRSQCTIFIMTPIDSKYKNLQKIPTHLCTSSHRFRYINIFFLYLQNADQGHRVLFSQWRHSMANINIYKSLQNIFALARFKHINIVNCLPLKRKSRSLEYNSRNYAIRWQISIFTKVSKTFWR